MQLSTSDGFRVYTHKDADREKLVHYTDPISRRAFLVLAEDLRLQRKVTESSRIDYNKRLNCVCAFGKNIDTLQELYQLDTYGPEDSSFECRAYSYFEQITNPLEARGIGNFNNRTAYSLVMQLVSRIGREVDPYIRALCKFVLEKYRKSEILEIIRKAIQEGVIDAPEPRESILTSTRKTGTENDSSEKAERLARMRNDRALNTPEAIIGQREELRLIEQARISRYTTE